MTTIKPEFSPEDIQAFTPSEKVGLVASVNFDGLPHISLITSMQARGPRELLLGEFVTGLSKKFIRVNHKIGFLIMTFSRHLWRGKAVWTHAETSGPEYEMMNLIPMFRYNTYFGISTVHYCDLVETSAKTPLPMNSIILAALKTRLAKGRLKTGKPPAGKPPADKPPADKPLRILKPFLENMFNQLDSLKFLAYLREDGFPALIPIIQCQAADSRRLAFAAGVYDDELRAIPPGSQAAVFCMNFGIEDVLVRGTFNGFKRSLGMSLATVDIEWVYNSMPPAVGQVYPEIAIRPVTEF
jgi:hypothetical protein